ncbi:MAG: response regulator [Chloroflexi bacterium]|nr:response regulator [Chloroflexota bacterium]
MFPKTINVLVVEDIDAYAVLLTRVLANTLPRVTDAEYRINRAVTLAEATEYSIHNPVDLILLDLGLPGTKGLNTLVKMHAAAPATAIIVLTAVDDENLTSQALEMGAEDYLIKGQFTKDTLLRSIGYAISRKQSRNALLASERRFRSLIENASDVVIIVNPELILTYASPSTYTLLGYTPTLVIGHDLQEIIHTYDLLRVKTLFATAQQSPGSGIRMLNVRIQHASGSWRIMNAIVTNLLEDSAVQGIVVNARDVTEQQQAEAVMQKVQRMESVGVLASSIAHDFNNLLTNVIAQNALALAKLPIDGPARVHIGKANNAVAMVVNLTRQLFAYAGKEHVQVEALNLNSFLLKNLVLLQAVLTQSIHLELDLAKQLLPTIDANGGQLQQVIMNLVINAAESIHPHAGKITISTRLEEFSEQALKEYIEGDDLRAGLYVVLEVSDTGRGMDAATCALIFEAFFSTKPHGHGLGLPSTLNIMRAHRGALRVQSESGQGTQLRLLFPIGKLQAQEMWEISELSQTQTNTALLIDDERLLLESLADLLGAAGLQTLTALHGRQGLELFKQYHNKIAVVVLDMKMPVMDGAETLRLLHEFDPEIEVILVSAYTIPLEVQQWTDKHKITMVAKPFDIDDLLSKIINTVVRHQHGQ